jgi:hypothetical protein
MLVDLAFREAAPARSRLAKSVRFLVVATLERNA